METTVAIPTEFGAHFAQVTAAIGDRPLDQELEAWLNRDYGRDSAWFAAAAAQCRVGLAEGWLGTQEFGGVKFSRAIHPGGVTSRFSVDVVEMNDVVGPHHSHPTGEIDLIMPLDGSARFDGKGAGWLVYEPGSAHFPTVSGGKALVLYLLPDGAIDFTPRETAAT